MELCIDLDFDFTFRFDFKKKIAEGERHVGLVVKDALAPEDLPHRRGAEEERSLITPLPALV